MDFGKYIAHRGLHDIKKGIPENSMKAFEEAIKKGVAIELDVRLSKDGRVVVFHDKPLKRMCGGVPPLTEAGKRQSACCCRAKGKCRRV